MSGHLSQSNTGRTLRCGSDLARNHATGHTIFMSTLSEIESAVARLSVPELIELERVVQHTLDDRRNLTTSTESQRPRVLGLHQGAWTVADEFDAPLPDEFWLGKDA